MDDKRIYVVVAESVDTPLGVINQPCGRVMAQVAHVVSKMQVALRLAEVREAEGSEEDHDFTFRPLDPCTTIVLSARDSRELKHIWDLLDKFRIAAVRFYDSNVAVYGEGQFMTAVCTTPVLACDVALVMEYLHTWRHGADDFS